ncbi:radical SAM protein [Candidatus Bathyarchaeota archaeon]|nr:MAG: radical SAM protein [Candidatus Bathyarchaeota archaeon]
MESEKFTPKKIRVSIGSAIVLGLLGGRIDAKPTTAYLLTYHKGKCTANCMFCPQARSSGGRADMLSRVTWPEFPLTDVVEGIKEAVKKGELKRVCIQALNYPKVFEDLFSIVSLIRSSVNVPISVSCQPLSRENLEKLKIAGVQRVGIPLDAATKEIFDKVKGRLANGPYIWEEQIKILLEAVKIFGENKVSTHLIVGLGEAEKDMIQRIQWCTDNGIFPGLFAFTPINGTALEKLPQPPLDSYRRIQLGHYLITRKISKFENFKFDKEGKIIDFGVRYELLEDFIESGEPFLTSGCPNCNRPYYNEKPGGPLYNYPRPLTKAEVKEIKNLLLKDAEMRP